MDLSAPCPVAVPVEDGLDSAKHLCVCSRRLCIAIIAGVISRGDRKQDKTLSSSRRLPRHTVCLVE